MIGPFNYNRQHGRQLDVDGGCGIVGVPVGPPHPQRQELQDDDAARIRLGPLTTIPH